MNAILPIRAKSNALQVSHSIVGYDRVTEKLSSEFEVPAFLDSLAQKIAEVDSDDPDGIFNYYLTSRQVIAFSFILGLKAAQNNAVYFLEPSDEEESYSEEKAEAISVFSTLSAKSQANNRRNRRITEWELTVPTLRILEDNDERWVTTSELIGRLTSLFESSGTDADIIPGRSDTYFSQKVRNMISHKESESSFIRNGLAEYNELEHGLRITKHGRALIRALRS